MNNKPIKHETFELIKIVGLALLISAVMAGFLMVKEKLDQVITIEYSTCVNAMYKTGDTCVTKL